MIHRGDVTRRETLEELRIKYSVMLEMRLVHDAGGEDENLARARMAELASRFPGALREIDDLELAVIEQRISQLDAALRGESAVEPWMHAVGLFHALARGALWAKRWLAGRKTIDAATAQLFERHAAERAADALVWTADLAAIAAPPRGRVMDLVFARVAQALGTTDAEARRLVFGPPRRGRPGGDFEL
jgi:hypothetical protein